MAGSWLEHFVADDDNQGEMSFDQLLDLLDSATTLDSEPNPTIESINDTDLELLCNISVSLS
jgi:hypothetical protein